MGLFTIRKHLLTVTCTFSPTCMPSKDNAVLSSGIDGVDTPRGMGDELPSSVVLVSMVSVCREDGGRTLGEGNGAGNVGGLESLGNQRKPD